MVRSLLIALPLAGLASFAMTSPVVADACAAEISALFDGPLDPFQRPPHRQIVTVLNAEGAETGVMLNTVETPLRTIAGQTAHNWFTMAIDREFWNGPTPEGPWTKNAALMPGGRAEQMANATAQQKANLTDTVCHGPDDQGRLRYTYRTQTDPDENGMYFGALETITLDPALGQVVHFELREFVNSWSEGVSTELQMIEVQFDDSIKVDPPS